MTGRKEEEKMKVTLKYDQGIKDSEVVGLEVCEQEFETMIEFDYQERLMKAEEGEVIERRTPQEILDEMNRRERNSWQTHTRHQHQFELTLEVEDDESIDTNTMDKFADYSEMEEMERQDDYEEQCQKIRQLLKPAQADMIIAICLDGMSVNDYSEEIGEDPKNVSKRFVRIKNSLREILS